MTAARHRLKRRARLRSFWQRCRGRIAFTVAVVSVAGIGAATMTVAPDPDAATAFVVSPAPPAPAIALVMPAVLPVIPAPTVTPSPRLTRHFTVSAAPPPIAPYVPSKPSHDKSKHHQSNDRRSSS